MHDSDSSIVNLTRGNTLCATATVASRALPRMRGLLGRSELPVDEGLLLMPAPSVHTAFMRFPIDVVFLDAELRVIKLVESLPPWRAASARRARMTLELPAGRAAAQRVGLGDALSIVHRTAGDARPSPDWPLNGRQPARRTLAHPRVTAVAAFTAAMATVAASPAGPRALMMAAVAAVLVVLAAIDLAQRIIPNRIVLPAAGLVLLAQLALSPESIGRYALAAALGTLLMALPGLAGRMWMGMGDAKLVGLLGAALGGTVLDAVMLAFLAVFPVALGTLIVRGAAGRKTTLPFGPFLALGGLIVLIAPHLTGAAH